MEAKGKNNSTIVLFDLDGTLTPPRTPMDNEMIDILRNLKKRVTIGIVSGSNESKLAEQIGTNIYEITDYMFPENGTVARLNGEMLGEDLTVSQYLGESNLQELINFALHYIADLDIPVKRGTFIEYRTGLLNISPIGRNCSRKERDEFEKFDKIHGIREKFATELTKRFKEKLGLQFAIGGQISIDCYPIGFDKTACLKHLEKNFKTIHFFGDKTEKGGNDYEIYEDPRTNGHSVKSPAETKQLIQSLFMDDI